MTLAATAASMRKLLKPEPRRWDFGFAWDQVIIEGALPPVPRGCDSRHGATWIWAQVEARLGHGIGQRVARFLFVNSRKPHVFVPPPFWDILAAERRVTDRDHFGQPTGARWVAAAPRKVGGWSIGDGEPVRFTVRIDGRPAGLDEGAAYALEVARRG